MYFDPITEGYVVEKQDGIDLGIGGFGQWPQSAELSLVKLIARAQERAVNQPDRQQRLLQMTQVLAETVVVVASDFELLLPEDDTDFTDHK